MAVKTSIVMPADIVQPRTYEYVQYWKLSYVGPKQKVSAKIIAHHCPGKETFKVTKMSVIFQKIVMTDDSSRITVLSVCLPPSVCKIKIKTFYLNLF